MEMSPEMHAEHMSKIKQGLQQAIDILNGLLVEEENEKNIDPNQETGRIEELSNKVKSYMRK